MIDVLIDDRIHWTCMGQDAEEETCGAELTASIDEAEYQMPEEEGKLPGRGAVIALPKCTCGAQAFLKADYTFAELSKVVCAVQNEQGVIWAYVLPLRYVRNLRLHWMLYERGKAEYAPIVPLPGVDLLAHPEMREVDDIDVAHALWFGFLVAKQRSLLVATKAIQKDLEDGRGTG